jgi:hypothetical protein
MHSITTSPIVLFVRALFIACITPPFHPSYHHHLPYTCPTITTLPYTCPIVTTCPTVFTCPTVTTILPCMYYYHYTNYHSTHVTTITTNNTHTISHMKWSSCHLSYTRWCKLHLRPLLRCMLDQPLRTWSDYTTSYVLTLKAHYGTHPSGTFGVNELA